MTHPITFTYLGFYLNSLVDSNESLDLEETHDKIRTKQLFNWLTKLYPQDLDVSLYTADELRKIEDFFESLSISVDEERKMGVSQNGLCLLVAYCFEGAQRKEKEV